MLNTSNWYSWKKRKNKDTETHTANKDIWRRRQRLEWGVHKPRDSKDSRPLPEAGTHKKDPPLERQGRWRPADTMTSDFRPPDWEGIHFYRFRPPSLYFVMAARWNQCYLFVCLLIRSLSYCKRHMKLRTHGQGPGHLAPCKTCNRTSMDTCSVNDVLRCRY